MLNVASKIATAAISAYAWKRLEQNYEVVSRRSFRERGQSLSRGAWTGGHKGQYISHKGRAATSHKGQYISHKGRAATSHKGQYISHKGRAATSHKGQYISHKGRAATRAPSPRPHPLP